MKATRTLLSLAVMGTLTLGFADASIDAPIAAIQAAPSSERVELMNEFKTQLSNMNAEDRSAAIAQMRTQMQAQVQNHDGSGEMVRERAQEHAQEMQMEHSEEMEHMQNMNQQQAGSQFGHDNERSDGSMNREGGSSYDDMFGERH